MATHTYKKCPHCGKTYETYSTYTKVYQNHSGCPFKRCRFCGETFVDKDIQEPALKPFSEDDFALWRCFFVNLMPYGLAGFLLTCCAFGLEESTLSLYIIAAIVDAVYIVSTYKVIKNRNVYLEEAKRDYQASEKRLSNPLYAQELKNAGFKVPSKYLK